MKHPANSCGVNIAPNGALHKGSCKLMQLEVGGTKLLVCDHHEKQAAFAGYKVVFDFRDICEEAIARDA